MSSSCPNHQCCTCQCVSSVPSMMTTTESVAKPLASKVIGDPDWLDQQKAAASIMTDLGMVADNDYLKTLYDSESTTSRRWTPVQLSVGLQTTAGRSDPSHLFDPNRRRPWKRTGIWKSHMYGRRCNYAIRSVVGPAVDPALDLSNLSADCASGTAGGECLSDSSEQLIGLASLSLV